MYVCAMQVIVIGAGVSGLTTAVEFAERGHTVAVWAEALPAETFSSVAAALWYPTATEPKAQTREWSLESLSVFLELSTLPESGVTVTPGHKLFHRRMGPPWWHAHVPEFSLLGKDVVPHGARCGYRFRVPVIDTSIYLNQYLPSRLGELGAKIFRRRLTSNEEALDQADLVINCSGLGARLLAQDSTVYPVRGQVAVLGAGAPQEILVDTDHPEGIVYVVPRRHDCIVGSVIEANCWSLEVNEVAGTQILQRAARMVPELRDPAFLGHRVGLRPSRPSVRLEIERLPEGKVLAHNYGHGGAGFTVSWGCARTLARVFSPEV